MATATMPTVSQCAVSGCSFNHGGCSAFAITVVAGNGTPDCGTYVADATKGGIDGVTAQVGACTRTDCAHNSALSCTADAITVGAVTGDRTPDCLTFSRR